jgi:hypothetical protein
MGTLKPSAGASARSTSTQLIPTAAEERNGDWTIRLKGVSFDIFHHLSNYTVPASALKEIKLPSDAEGGRRETASRFRRRHPGVNNHNSRRRGTYALRQAARRGLAQVVRPPSLAARHRSPFEPGWRYKKNQSVRRSGGTGESSAKHFGRPLTRFAAITIRVAEPLIIIYQY